MIYVGLPVALIAILAVAGVAVRDKGQASRLLLASPDSIVRDNALVEIARQRATPLYAAHCASCHGASMMGDRSTGAADLRAAAPLYGEGRVSEIEQTILYGIRSGHPKGRNLADMPGFGRQTPYPRYVVPPLDPAAIRDVASFIASREGLAADPAEIASGRTIYAGRGGCFDCHGEDARGDPAIGAPDLADHDHLYGDGSAASLRRIITEGRGGSCPSWTGRLGAADIRALAVFIAAGRKPDLHRKQQS